MTYYEEHKEKCLAYSKDYKAKHKEAKQLQDKEYARTHKEQRRKTSRTRRERNKLAWLAILMDLGMFWCRNCGYDACFAALDFHHRDPKNKEYSIASLLKLKPTSKRVKELGKVTPLCATCHREFHSEVHDGFTNNQSKN